MARLIRKSGIILGSLMAAGMACAATYSPRVVKLYEPSDMDALLEAGAQIFRQRGDIVLCLIPSEGENGEAVSNGNGPRRKLSGSHRGAVRHGDFNVPALDVASGYYDAYHILSGEGLPSAYTGKGVVAGFCDIGIDPLHPTFLDEDGHSRVKRVIQYKEREGERIVVEGDDAYMEWVTDTSDHYHATHVGGIMAGNGGGTPYAGIARDADIVVSTSTLTDFGLLAGVEDIIDYAKEVGKPCVINLSMGNYVGAHDGTSLFSQYLEMCSDDAVIVLSAGNEGTHTNTLTGLFTPEKTSVGFRLGNKAWDQRAMYGMTDIWSSGPSPLSVQISIFDDKTKKIVHAYEPVRLGDGFDGDWFTYEWNPSDPVFDGCSLNGYLTVVGGVDRENGRYEVALLYDYESTALVEGGWARDVVAVKVSGSPGEDVEIYADGSYTRLMNFPGEPVPGSSLSISDLACGQGVVSVGMYGNRSSVPVSRWDSSEGKYVVYEENTEFKEGNTVSYSSYGTLRDGRVLPMTVAPGASLVSAGNRAFFDKNPDYGHLRLDAPWVSETGTSMSAPYVAGYIATWLEALPGLKFSDVEAMISSTNHLADIPEPENPRNANGYFDPLAALRKGLSEGGVHGVSHPGGLLLPDDEVTVYNLSGVIVYEGAYSGVSSLASGVYVVHTPFGVTKMTL